MTVRATGVRFALFALSAALVLGLAPGAFGGKPPSGGGGTIALKVLDSTDGVPHYGQRVTFDVSTTATAYPRVQVECRQGDTLVYSASAGFYASYPWPWERNFTLASTWWTGGAADCTAALYYWNGKRLVTLTTTSFHVYA